jgi:hypothetical protein
MTILTKPTNIKLFPRGSAQPSLSNNTNKNVTPPPLERTLLHDLEMRENTLDTAGMAISPLYNNLSFHFFLLSSFVTERGGRANDSVRDLRLCLFDVPLRPVSLLLLPTLPVVLLFLLLYAASP